MDFDAGVAAIDRLGEPNFGVSVCVETCYELVDVPAERRARLLEVALGYARAEPHPGLPLARMATADSPRATRLARTLIDPYERAFALGTVAHALAASDRAADATQSAFRPGIRDTGCYTYRLCAA